MRIVVVGTGGVGGYFGARLALAGNDVRFIARGKQLEAIQKNGLRILRTDGEFAIKPAKVTNDLAVANEADLVMIATKAWQVREVATKLSPYIAGETMILPMQNGVLAAKELAEYIPEKHIVGGLCRIFSKIESPGVIRHMGSDPTIIFGEFDHQKTERTAWLKYTFDMAGFTSIWSDRIALELWKKLLMISSSALLAITKTTYGEARSIPETRRMMQELLSEIYKTGLAEGINYPENIVEKTMKAIDNFPPDSTSSLTRDIWEGKPSEIEYQNGTVVKIAKKHGLEVPVNEFIYNCILPMEKKARAKMP